MFEKERKGRRRGGGWKEGIKVEMEEGREGGRNGRRKVGRVIKEKGC